MSEPPAPRTVLVADDEPGLLRLVERLLARQGYEVLTASDGDEAAARLGRAGGSIAVAVIDAGIAPHGWIEVLREAAVEPASLGVVLTSGAALPPLETGRLEWWGGVFLQKPFAPQALLQAVEKALPGPAV